MSPRPSRMCLPASLALWVAAGTISHASDEPTYLSPRDGGFTRSMGIPSLVKAYTGLEAQWYRPAGEDHGAGHVNLGMFRYLGNPTVGILALGGETYLGGRDREMDVGLRGMAFLPSLYVAAGVDYNVEDDEADFLLRFDVPVRRGGIVGVGSSLSLRWLPTRDHTLSLGLTVPIGDHYAGKSRPPKEYVTLDRRKPERLEDLDVHADIADALSTITESARWIAWLSLPFAEESGGDPAEAIGRITPALVGHVATVDDLFPRGHTLLEETRVYHEALDRAFSVAISGVPATAGQSTVMGRQASATARRLLLEHVIFPYNYFFGLKKRSDTLSGMIAVAQTAFGRWLLSDTDFTDDQARDAFFVFQTLCDAVEENRAELLERWEDGRLVWLPLQYGFKAEEHDTQDEIDEILERATREEMAEANRLWYIVNEEFQWEMARSVAQAEDYHVLWIHDVSGVNHHGAPDRMAFLQVRQYLETMIHRVEAYDDTGKFPVYMILLDQHYFETNQSRLWMQLLEDPLRHRIDLGDDHAEMQTQLEQLQDRLRTAVEESLLLKFETSQYGEKWLHNRIKVHVNITNPADPSFRSIHVIGILPVPDNNMRDHRKIIFYDVTEEDPYRGMAMFTGMGIGEHYIGENWEDRAVMLQGPAALAVKTAARDLLLIQGFEEEEIPFPLRELPRDKSWDAKVAAETEALPLWNRNIIGVMQLHNETGFTPKPINVGKAVLYTMMPPGSVIKVPDSLWQSHIYASMLAGSALRGCRVMIIAPTLASAPSSGWPQMARAHGLMGRIIAFENDLQEAIDGAGGLLKVGMYSPRYKVGDIAGRLRQAADESPPWADRVYSFDPSVGEFARNAKAFLDSIGYEPRYLKAPEGEEHTDEETSPKLHLKANFFASPQAWDDFLARPEWKDILREYVRYLARQQGTEVTSGENAPNVQESPLALRKVAEPFLADYFSSLSPEERDRVVLYLTVGSVNMDYRSQVMNGEVMILLGGVKSLVGLLDFILLAGLCEWPETQEELNALLSPPGGIKRRIASLIKLAL